MNKLLSIYKEKRDCTQFALGEIANVECDLYKRIGVKNIADALGCNVANVYQCLERGDAFQRVLKIKRLAYADFADPEAVRLSKRVNTFLCEVDGQMPISKVPERRIGRNVFGLLSILQQIGQLLSLPEGIATHRQLDIETLSRAINAIDEIMESAAELKGILLCHRVDAENRGGAVPMAEHALFKLDRIGN